MKREKPDTGWGRCRASLGWAAGLPILVAAAVPAIPICAYGQVVAGSDSSTKDTLGTFVPDSTTAVERFTLAEKLEKAAEWGKASEIYQELLENYRDRVLPADVTQADASSYISVPDRVFQKLSQWPGDGIAVYNGRYQPAAELLLQQATDGASLQVVADRYLLTQAGGIAARRLMQIWWDRGEPAATARMAQRLASLNMGTPEQKSLLLYQAGVAWQLAHHGDRARLVLEQLRKEYPGAQGVVAGEGQDLAAALENAVAAAAAEQAVESSSWMAYGGSPDRASLPSGEGKSDALLFSIDLTAPPANTQVQPNGLPPMAGGRAVPQAFGLGVFPVYDKGQLFFQDGYNLFALSIDGGMKLPGWQSPTVEVNSNAWNGPSLRSLAISDDAIFALSTDLSTPIWTGGDAGGSNPGVICRDRQTGKRRWTFNPATANMPPAAKATVLASPPLVAGDKLFIAARGGRSAQFTDVYVICLDSRTGKFLWASYVASGPNQGMGWLEGMPMVVDAQTPQLSYHAGRVVVLSNVGAIAALDAGDGSPAWIRLYARARQNVNPNMMWRMLPGDPSQQGRLFSCSPPVVVGGRIFALPVDGKSLLVLDESDGTPIKEIALSSIASQNLDTLVGMIGDQVVLAGEKGASVIDWRDADEHANKQKKAIRWAMNFPSAGLRGRPFLTTQALFLPTEERLLRINTAHWKIDQTTPRYPSTWDVTKEGPGNVLVTDEHVIVATARRINVYTDLASATAKLDREIGAKAELAEPLVRYCELLFAAGQHQPAMAKLASAAAVITARADTPGEVRDRVLSCALSCANRLASSNQAAMQTLASGYLNIARSLATHPEQAVQYHLASAAIELRANHAPQTLAHLQAVLDEPARRVVFSRDNDGQSRYGGEIARRQIRELIDRFGGEIYQATQQVARQQFAAASSANDPAGLIEVARKYPDAIVAPEALLSAAKLQEEVRHYSDAAATLRQLTQDYSRHADAAVFIEAMARVYAAMPGKAPVAAGRLAAAAAIMGDPMTRGTIRLPDGQLVQPMHFSEAAKALRDMAGARQTSPLPDLHLPSQAMWQTPFATQVTISDVQADHVLDNMPNCDTDYRHAIVASPQGDIAILDTTGKILVRVPQATRRPAQDYAWLSPTLLLVRANDELAAINLNTSQIVWRLDAQKLPAVTQVIDDAQPDATAGGNPLVAGRPGVFNARLNRRLIIGANGAPIGLAGARPAAEAKNDSNEIRDVAVAANRVVFGTGNGRVAALDAGSGKLLWQLRPDSGTVQRLLASDDFAVVKCGTAQKTVLAAIDNDTGRLIFRKAFQGNSLQNIALSDDGKLVYTLTAQLVCKDLFDQSDRNTFETPMPNGVAFADQDRVDQLVLTDSQIIATSDAGSQVRMFSLFTGRQILPGGRSAGETPVAQLPRDNGVSIAHLTMAEPYAYVNNNSAVRAINLLSVENTERRVAGARNIRQVVAGTRHVAVFDIPLREGDANSVPSLHFVSFSRTPTRNGESGKVEHDATIRQDAGITSWQIVEGGLYLTTTDKKLVFMPVSKEAR